MQIHVRLYGTLRDFLPIELKGRTTLELSDPATPQDVIDAIGLDHPVLVAVNNQHETETSYPLSDGDHVGFFEFGAGGLKRYTVFSSAFRSPNTEYRIPNTTKWQPIKFSTGTTSLFK